MNQVIVPNLNNINNVSQYSNADAQVKGDAGRAWKPILVGFTGSASVMGRIYCINQNMVFFNIKITPSGNLSGSVGSSYIEGLPYRINEDGFCNAFAGNGFIGAGFVNAADKRIYAPAFSSVSGLISLSGIVAAGGL